MVRLIIALAALSSLTIVAAQYTINPDEVPEQTRATWCTAETNNCQLLCGSTSALNNTCSYIDLSFNCTCANGTAPGLDYYTGTMPTFICDQAFADCTDANQNNEAGLMNCTSSIKDHCGTLNPVDVVVTTSTSTSASASGMASTMSMGSGSATAAATTAPASSSSKAAAPTNGAFAGSGFAAVAAGIAAALL